MKVLYLGHYKEGTGWSYAAINNILALNTLDIDLVTRNIPLTKELEVPEQILELEKKDLQDVDVCIQHLLPHHLVGTTKFKKNIAYFAGETNTLKYSSNWLQSLMMMDEVWVPCDQNAVNLKDDGIQKVKVVPHTFDISDYKKIDKVGSDGIPNHTFKFYYIGDMNDRKNLNSVIKCFHTAFSKSDQVDLILKISSHLPQDQAVASISQTIENIKKEMRLYANLHDYKNEHVITRRLNDYEMKSLHSMCDCYLCPSHGEGWSIPAFEAMAYGNTPICSKDGGPESFIDPSNKSTGTLINGVKKICNHQNSAFKFLGTAREFWFEPDDEEIISAMKYYVKNKNSIDRTQGYENASNYSYKNVSKTMLEFINE